ncbi:hypothetical protein CIPAW_12G024800 [Carya illinoinensis]|uniref:Uncharacterized protein n=1 Tax=Carya illinoinensis TaxID=32201 RepID=A0A8T1NWJ0_CARIL|nr:hypothetical protein CIPAW_12G024800 [Carya illinoinensis]
MPYDLYANPLAMVRPRPTNKFLPANKVECFKKIYFVNLFYIEKSIETDPFQIASDYFPCGFHWIPENPTKYLKFYLGILLHIGSISIKPINCKGIEIQYNYYDYIKAWSRFPLFQILDFQHSWFFNFDKKCKNSFPLWFQKCWHHFDLIPDIFPDSLQRIIKHFNISNSPKMKGRDAKFPYLLHFCTIYKSFVKWWDRYPYTNDIVSYVSRDFLLVVPSLKSTEEFPSPSSISKQALITYPTIPEISKSPTNSKDSSSKQKKASSSARKKNSKDSESSSSLKKKSPLEQLKKKDLIQLLKKFIKDELNNNDSAEESEASYIAEDSDPYSNTFEHDYEDYPPFLRDD